MHERRRNLEAFKAGDVKILIATDVAARGIDVQGLPCVVNVTLPDVPPVCPQGLPSGSENFNTTIIVIAVVLCVDLVLMHLVTFCLVLDRNRP